jgi:hypothetical protein
MTIVSKISQDDWRLQALFYVNIKMELKEHSSKDTEYSMVEKGGGCSKMNGHPRPCPKRSITRCADQSTTP